MSERKDLINDRLKGVDPAMAEQSGFNRRMAPTDTQPAPTIDGRSLRRTGRNKQFNMKVTAATHARFWQAAQRHGFTAGEQLLTHLLDRDEDDA